jgi:hypothetical protein
MRGYAQSSPVADTSEILGDDRTPHDDNPWP